MAWQASILAMLWLWAVSGSAFAETLTGQIALSPGLWESSSSIEVIIVRNGTSETVLTPTVEVREQCLRSENALLDAADLAGPGCRVLASDANGAVLNINIACRREDGEYGGWMTAQIGEEGLSTVAELELKTIRGDGSERIIRAHLSSRRSGPCLD